MDRRHAMKLLGMGSAGIAVAGPVKALADNGIGKTHVPLFQIRCINQSGAGPWTTINPQPSRLFLPEPKPGEYYEVRWILQGVHPEQEIDLWHNQRRLHDEQ